MKTLRIRQATIADIPEIIMVEDEAWSDGQRATEEMFVSRITVFPQGCLIAENSDRIVGVVATEIVRYDVSATECPSWGEITDNGFIRNSHKPDGESIYGVDLSVSPLANGGASKLLMLAVGKMVIRQNLKQIILGGRMPRYHKFADKMSPQEYLNARTTTGKHLDPEVWFYHKAGLEVVRVIPNYFYDPDSCNNGVLLVWKNPFYNNPFRKLCSWLFQI